MEIRRLSPALCGDYLRFFDETPHDDNRDESKCYCVCWSAADSTGRDFSSAEKRRALAEECKGRLPPMYRVFLDKCRGELSGGTVTVYAPDEIVRGRLDNDRVLGAIQELGALKAGGSVTVRLSVGAGPAVSKEDRLQELIRMGSKLDHFTVQ